MQLWSKIKQIIRKQLEKEARIELTRFICEAKPFNGEDFPRKLKRSKERIAYKQNLTETYTYQEGDDLLAKKQDFIKQYTVNERKQFDYFIKDNPFPPGEIQTRVWREHEQCQRFWAQKAWRKVVRRNHREHMRAKFMNQKTR